VGRVTRFDAAKGYALISSAKDVYIHYFSGVDEPAGRTLKAGDLVEYERIVGPRGRPEAPYVRILKKSAPKKTAPKKTGK
jgi:cold shock CspA family protein